MNDEPLLSTTSVGDFSAAVHRALALYAAPADYAALRANARAHPHVGLLLLAWFRRGREGGGEAGRGARRRVGE